LPTGAAYNYSTPWRPVNEDFGLSRFDYTVSTQDTFSTSFSADRGFRADPQANPVIIQKQGSGLYSLSAQKRIFSPPPL